MLKMINSFFLGYIIVIAILNISVKISKLFSFRLRDPSRQVRKNTLQVLTHLILNDMVKVKGQISEMATCIMDDDERISALAKLFFHELAKKVMYGNGLMSQSDVNVMYC